MLDEDLIAIFIGIFFISLVVVALGYCFYQWVITLEPADQMLVAGWIGISLVISVLVTWYILHTA